MEPENSSPHSQVSATCPYPEPAQTSPYPPIPLLEDLFNYYPYWGHKNIRSKNIEFRRLELVQPWCTLCYLFKQKFKKNCKVLYSTARIRLPNCSSIQGSIQQFRFCSHLHNEHCECNIHCDQHFKPQPSTQTNKTRYLKQCNLFASKQCVTQHLSGLPPLLHKHSLLLKQTPPRSPTKSFSVLRCSVSGLPTHCHFLTRVAQSTFTSASLGSCVQERVFVERNAANYALNRLHQRVLYFQNSVLF
jgi:hypothetical protein